MSLNDILKEIEELDYGIKEEITGDSIKKAIESPDLPVDCINLFDSSQLRYHKNNQIIKKCLDVIAYRRLDTAINKPKALYVSLVDKVHKNRLIIPFYDDGKCVYYQSRGILDKDLQDRPKYLSKIGGNQTLFNFDRISSDCNTIYMLEGPLDSFFIKNSVGIAGIQEKSHTSLTKMQQDMLSKHFLASITWVLDSQWQDRASLSKTGVLIDQGLNVFIWPKSLGTRFKDINDICTAQSIDSIPRKLIDEYTFRGLKAKLALSEIK